MKRHLHILMLSLLALLPAALRAQDFPQNFPHMFGETVVEAAPKRVVSLGYTGHDNLLALGVVPVALRYWYGENPDAVWPWAQTALGGAHPVVLRGDLSIEQVAGLQPDLIIAISSGITADEYALLSQIAPTIASAAQYGDFNTPWDVHARTIGRATGHLAEADAQITAIEGRYAEVRAAHPQWQGKTAVAGYYWAGVPGAYKAADPRAALLDGFGFVTPPAVEAAGDPAAFYTTFSAEDLSPLDADVLVWIAQSEDAAPLRDLPLRKSLNVHETGGEIWADTNLAAALSHASLLSIPVAMDRLIPALEEAADGDPATVVSLSQAVGLAP